MADVPLTDNATQEDITSAHNRSYYRNHGNATYGEAVRWRYDGTDATYLLDIDNSHGEHANFGGVLTVTDTATTISGPTAMAGLTCTTLHATAAAQLDTTLAVNGASTLTGNVGMGGNATVAGTFGVTGQTNVGVLVVGSNASVAGTLGVTAATTLTTLTTNGLYTANAGLTVAGGTTTTGTLNAGATSATTLSTSSTASLHDAAITAGLSVGGTSTLAGVSAGATSVTTLNASGLITGGAGLTISAGNTSLAGTTTAVTLTASNTLTAQANFLHTGSAFAMFGSAAQTKQTITGSRGGNAALANLLSALANHGMITDSTT
jgi:hypothetical protein